MSSNTGKSLAHNVTLLVGFQALAKVLSAGWIFYMARKLGTAGYGLWANVMAVAAIFSALQDVGSFPVFVKEVSQNRERASGYYGVCLSLFGFFSLLVLLLLMGFAGAMHYSSEQIFLTGLAGLSILLFSAGYASQAVLYAFEEFKIHVFWSFLGTLFYLACGVILLQSGYGVAGVLAALCAGNLLMSLLLYRVTRAKYGRPEGLWSLSQWPHFIKLGLPLMLSSLFYELMVRSDRVLIGRFIGDSAVGLYQAAFFIAFVPRELLLIPVLNAVYPRLALVYAQDFPIFQMLLERLTMALIVAALFISIMVSFFSEIIIRVLYGKAYGSAGQILAVLAWICLPMFVSILWNSIFIIQNRTRIFMAIRVCVFAVGFLLNFVCLPRWGILASAWSQLIAQVLFMVLVLAFLSGRHPPSFLRRLPRVAGACLCTVSALFLFQRLNLFSPALFWIPAILAPLLYAFFVFAFRVIQKEELEWLNRQRIALHASIKNLYGTAYTP